jgi:hypothetical protein
MNSAGLVGDDAVVLAVMEHDLGIGDQCSEKFSGLALTNLAPLTVLAVVTPELVYSSWVSLRSTPAYADELFQLFYRIRQRHHCHLLCQNVLT